MQGLESSVRSDPNSQGNFQTDGFRFGKFVFLAHMPNDHQYTSKFEGHNFRRNYWKALSEVTLDGILDLRQGGYTDEEIMESLNLMSVPTSMEIYDLINRCSACYRPGHNVSSCPGTICQVCVSIGHICDNCYKGSKSFISPYANTTVKQVWIPKQFKKVWIPKKEQKHCTLCLRSGHTRASCIDGPRCNVCDQLGHFSFSCPNKFKRKGCWVIKKKFSTAGSIPKARGKPSAVWVVKKKLEQNQENIESFGKSLLTRKHIFPATPVMDGATPEHNSSDIDMDHAHEMDVEPATDVITDGGDDSPFVFLLARGMAYVVKISPMTAYLDFMKLYIYKKNLLALTDSIMDPEGSQIALNTQLNTFFKSCVMYSAWPAFLG